MRLRMQIEMETRSTTTYDWPWTILEPRRTSWLFIALFYVAALAVSAAIVLLVFQNSQKWLWPAWWLQNATSGALDLTLSVNLLSFIILVVGILIGIGGMRARDLGVYWNRFPAGIFWTIVLLGIVFVIQWVGTTLSGARMAWNPVWTSDRWSEALGRWLNQLFGNTLFEEVVYPGFFLGQVAVLLGRRWNHRPWLRLAMALLISQSMFALAHLWINLSNQSSPWIYLAQFVSGLLFAALFLITQNLFLVMGVHTLINNPPPPWTEWQNGGVIAGVLLLLFVMATLWMTIWRRYCWRS